MASEDGSSSGVLSRLRAAVTGTSSAGEQEEPAQAQKDTAHSQAGTEQAQNDGELIQEDPAQAQKDAETSRTEPAETSGPSQARVEAYADIMEQCAAGDLTQRMEAAGNDETMDRIALGFNDMGENLEKTTVQLKSYVDEVESAGVGVERSADTVRRASGDVVDAMQNVSADAEAQREELQTISEALDDVAATLEQFAASHPDAEIEPQVNQIGVKADEIRDVATTSEAIQTETTIVSAAAEEQAAELGDISSRAGDLQRYSNPLNAILGRFDTESKQEPGSPPGSPTGEEQEGIGD